ncbi:hypothetical protein [Clostridium septicum]|uniref:Uncharacterized protein n=1 Tax=Clostridium septicum TaxID=1504 RepID=A0A9N7JLS1_CLOSE|nr:hypothetical protein [Clostridium septicum]AYE34087.1 hypothetical protein CP523_06180 [Clostridium septicum]UEC21290.1 hypothetical protein LK444_02635 [Clostridium septicum]USS00666.1 hypothetical protein NH397_14465 [Clostridium septicum]
MLKLQKPIFVLMFSLFLLFFKGNITNAEDFKVSSGNKEQTTLLSISVNGVDSKTNKEILFIPFVDLSVQPGGTLKYSRVIEIIQESVNEIAGYNKFKVEGFSDNVELREGFSETYIKLKNNEDIHLPKIDGLNNDEVYAINGDVIISEYPKLEIPSDLEYDIKVVYSAFFYEKLEDGGYKRLSFFHEEDLEGFTTDSKLDSKQLQYLAQKALDNRFGINQYKITSRRIAVARNMTQSIYNNYQGEILSGFETNDQFTYTIKPQIKDPKVSEYLTCINDNFYVEKVNSENNEETTINPDFNENNYTIDTSTSELSLSIFLCKL